MGNKSEAHDSKPGQLKGELEVSRALSRSNEADIRCAALEAELRVLKRHEEEVSTADRFFTPDVEGMTDPLANNRMIRIKKSFDV